VRPSKTRMAIQATFFLLTIVMAIAKIIVGSNNTDNCRVEPMVPKFLIGKPIYFSILFLILSFILCSFSVSGALTLIISFIRLIHTAATLAWAKEKLSSFVALLEASIFTAFEFLLSLAAFCWFIAGSVYVFRVFEPDYIHPRIPNYCDETTYKFAFYFLILTYGFIAFSIGLCLLFCACACCGAVCGSKSR